MKNLLFLLFAIALCSFYPDNKPTGTGVKWLQSPVFFYNQTDSAIYVNMGYILGWAKLDMAHDPFYARFAEGTDTLIRPVFKTDTLNLTVFKLSADSMIKSGYATNHHLARGLDSIMNLVYTKHVTDSLLAQKLDTTKATLQMRESWTHKVKSIVDSLGIVVSGTDTIPVLKVDTANVNILSRQRALKEYAPFSHNQGIPTITALQDSLNTKERMANKTLSVTTDGASDTKYPSAKAVKTYSDGKVADVITDGVTTVAPSENAVFDALALKQSALNGGTGFVKTATGTISYDNSTYSISTHAHSGTYEVPLTFSTGLSRVGNTITASGSSMVYPGAGIPLSTGSAWGTSITNNSANWNTAYGWGNHASYGYLTGTISHTHGNITYSGAIGSTTGLPIITTTSGVLTTGSFGTTAGTFAQGNDSRFSGGSMVYPGAGIPLSTGSAWGTSITNSSANWNAAYGWGNHASAGYLTSVTNISGNSGTVTVAANTTNATYYPVFVTSATGSLAPQTTAAKLTFNPSTGNLTATIFQLSDRRYKNHIKKLSRNDYSKIAQIEFRKCYMNDDSTNKRHYVVIAQDVEKIFPETEYSFINTDENGKKTVNYTELLLAKIAQLEQLLKDQERRIKTLERK